MTDDVITPMGNGGLARQCEFGRAVQGQEVINAFDGMVGDPRERVAQPRFWIDSAIPAYPYWVSSLSFQADSASVWILDSFEGGNCIQNDFPLPEK